MFLISLILSTTALIYAAYFSFAQESPGGWLWLATITGAFLTVPLLTTLRSALNRRLVWLTPLLISTGLIAQILLLEPTLVTYVSGIWLLLSIWAIHLLPKTNEANGKNASTPIILFIALALTCIPIQVNQILINLPSVAVPTHFALFDSPEATPSKIAMYYQDMDTPNPLTVVLHTDSHVFAGNTMPMLRLAVVRDSNIAVQKIYYQSQIAGFSVKIKKLSYQHLHQLTLNPLSHNVQLQKTETGILVDGIAQGEEAWIDLPGFQNKDIETQDQLTIIAIRLIIWAFLCFAFLLWKPERNRTRTQ